MERSSNKISENTGQIRKYLPLFLLITLTAALMFFFKYNKRSIGKMIDEGKSSFLSFYAENLKPLLVQTQISEEDIFNFALYQCLPLDKGKNRVLVISNEATGNQIYEIKPASYNPYTKNYETFTRYLGLNNIQKEKADSILNSYKKDIYSSILINNKNSYAVNPKITKIQQAILADLFSFARKVNGEKIKELFPKMFDNGNNRALENLVAAAKEIPKNDFILITPDTVAKTHFKWDEEQFQNQLKEYEMKKEFAQQRATDFDFQLDLEELNKNANGQDAPNFSFKLDSNFFKVVVPVEAMDIPDFIADSIRIKLNEAAQKLKTISFSASNKKFKIKIEGLDDIRNAKKQSKKNWMSIVNPYEIAGKTMEMLSKMEILSNRNMKLEELEELGVSMDSISRLYKAILKDSVNKKIRGEILKQNKKLKKLNSTNDFDTVKINIE
ncbi:MAG: hypothetical protein AB1298_07255 [Bacteroidota bacterium]